MRSCTHFRIKLDHAIDNINGLRYVQLKWCLLKRKSECLPLQEARTQRSPLHRSVFPLHGATALHHYTA